MPFCPKASQESTGDCPRENTAPYRAIAAFVSSATAGGRTDGATAVAAKAMHITVAKCFIFFTHIIPFRAAHLPRYLPTRRDAASPCAAKTAHNLLDETYPPKLRNSQQRKQPYSGGRKTRSTRRSGNEAPLQTIGVKGTTGTVPDIFFKTITIGADPSSPLVIYPFVEKFVVKRLN